MKLAIFLALFLAFPYLAAGQSYSDPPSESPPAWKVIDRTEGEATKLRAEEEELERLLEEKRSDIRFVESVASGLRKTSDDILSVPVEGHNLSGN